MQIKDKVVVVTGGANGIGQALCQRFAAEGARGVVVADLDQQTARALAQEIGGLAVPCDVSVEGNVIDLVERTVDVFGPIDLFCSNAGITAKGGIETPDEDWQHIWEVNVLSLLYAARSVIPGMLERGSGYLLQTASGAGLLTEIGSAAYSVSKHASVALAEWLSIRYGASGIGVSCLCPLGVETDMLDKNDPIHEFLRLSAIRPEEVAEAVLRGLADERFLILPHPEVAEFLHYKTDDHERWLRGMRRLQEKLTGCSRMRRGANRGAA